MQLEKIVTLANKHVQLRFLAMERSLRDTGCNLPLWVIPYDDNLFELPPNAQWWVVDEITKWLDSHRAHRMMRKYQCLTTTNYQFVDTDIIFLRNPIEVLMNKSGFITSCGHWRSPAHTYTNESVKFLHEKSSTWEKNIFNAGQFACDIQLYNFHTLKATAEKEGFINTCIKFEFHDQPGLNLLVNAANVKISNLTLPPYEMESTFAADYYEVNGTFHQIDHNYLWTKDPEKKPYIIHWAGCRMFEGYEIDKLFLKYLKGEEIQEWHEWVTNSKNKSKTSYFQSRIAKLKSAIKILIS